MAILHAYTLTMITMVAFASNSLICLLALEQTSIDAASSNTLRLLSGALLFWSILGLQRNSAAWTGDWASVCALFTNVNGRGFHQFAENAYTTPPFPGWPLC